MVIKMLIKLLSLKHRSISVQTTFLVATELEETINSIERSNCQAWILGKIHIAEERNKFLTNIEVPDFFVQIPERERDREPPRLVV